MQKFEHLRKFFEILESLQVFFLKFFFFGVYNKQFAVFLPISFLIVGSIASA